MVFDSGKSGLNAGTEAGAGRGRDEVEPDVVDEDAECIELNEAIEEPVCCTAGFPSNGCFGSPPLRLNDGEGGLGSGRPDLTGEPC